MPQQCEPKGNPEQVSLSPALPDDVGIVRLQRVKSREVVAVAGYADQLLALCVVQKFMFAPHHGESLSKKHQSRLRTVVGKETYSADGYGGCSTGSLHLSMERSFCGHMRISR